MAEKIQPQKLAEVPHVPVREFKVLHNGVGPFAKGEVFRADDTCFEIKRLLEMGAIEEHFGDEEAAEAVDPAAGETETGEDGEAGSEAPPASSTDSSQAQANLAALPFAV